MIDPGRSLMMDPPEKRTPDKRPDDGTGAEFDWQSIRNTIALVLSAYKRHPVLSIGVVVGVIAASVLTAVLMPRSYTAHLVLLVQRNHVLPSIANPTRNTNEEAGTRGVQESILSHDNLAQIVKQADLLKRFEEERAPILRWKDRVFGAKAFSEKEQFTNMVYTLEKRIGVTLDDAASTVSLSAEWSSPQTAHLIASLLQKNFMEQRYAAEVSIFEEGIAILEERVAKEQQSVDDALAQVVRAREEAGGRGSAVARPEGAASPAATASAARRSETKSDLMRQVESKGSALRAAEENRRHQIAEATRALAELSTTYAPAHPMVIAQERKLEAARRESPELLVLRREHRDLMGEVTEFASKNPDAHARAGHGRAGTVLSLGSDQSLRVEEASPAVTLASTVLADSSRRYLELQERIKAQQLEFDLARAAYKHNYAVVSPPEVPRQPSKPKPGLLVGGGVVLALVLGLVVAAIRDLASGRFIEPWQARRLGLPVLGVVPKP